METCEKCHSLLPEPKEGEEFVICPKCAHYNIIEHETAFVRDEPQEPIIVTQEPIIVDLTEEEKQGTDIIKMPMPKGISFEMLRGEILRVFDDAKDFKIENGKREAFVFRSDKANRQDVKNIISKLQHDLEQADDLKKKTQQIKKEALVVQNTEKNNKLTPLVQNTSPNFDNEADNQKISKNVENLSNEQLKSLKQANDFGMKLSDIINNRIVEVTEGKISILKADLNKKLMSEMQNKASLLKQEISELKNLLTKENKELSQEVEKKLSDIDSRTDNLLSKADKKVDNKMLDLDEKSKQAQEKSEEIAGLVNQVLEKAQKANIQIEQVKKGLNNKIKQDRIAHNKKITQALELLKNEQLEDEYDDEILEIETEQQNTN